ncbi:hypothetical protein EON63_23140, partial [archaeon]
MSSYICSHPIHIHDSLVYDEWQMRRQLGGSQAAALLLFGEEGREEEGDGDVGYGYKYEYGYGQKPRYEVILQRMKDTYRHQKTSLAMLDHHNDEDGDGDRIHTHTHTRSSSRLPSLRQAMYDIVQERQRETET